MDDAIYAESGSSFWPVLWGPAFAVAGYLLELLTGPASGVLWFSVGFGLMLLAVLWVNGRRRLSSLKLTADKVYFGRERLPVSSIAAVDDVGAPAGARVLGGGWSVPKGTTGVPLRLVDGVVVLGWARDPESFLRALRRVVRG